MSEGQSLAESHYTRTKFSVRPLVPILVLCATLVFLCAGVGGAFVVFMAAPFLGFWLIYSGYIICFRKEKRRVQAIRAGILTATLVGIAVLHFYYYTSARAAGNYAESLVSAYKAKHGTYPDSLEEAGWRLGAYGGRWHIIYHGNGASKDPILLYPATWIVFDKYNYNFKLGQWGYLPD